ncbi:putative fatty acid methyltransferase [Zancudomyces culisetae]|uniref:Putative fatty acid methyltransferase n=1 Tax=Zancudomyces culisetae TaxID=1213189 RepID=A0A1R1PT48_ZANCU|nr:putative fatty acid methyltransferase [Zancudomyces culisetae]|eukprot:OMH84099.1 putative fatty acid methyltransferase [Zancudomyces culisetae]
MESILQGSWAYCLYNLFTFGWKSYGGFKNNISAHYDLGNEFFLSFLDEETHSYSSAIWKNPSDTLEVAQINKVDMIIEMSKITKDDYVLDIGCGWGFFMTYAARKVGCRVLGITLSVEQKKEVDRKIMEHDLAEKCKVQIIDYRNLDENTYCFDKIVSVEMIEHVGNKNLGLFFKKCDRLLNKERGCVYIQSTTINDERYEKYTRENEFIREYIFPGVHCPSVSLLVGKANNGSDGRLFLNEVRNHPMHYAKTLYLWRKKLNENFHKIEGHPCIAPEMITDIEKARSRNNAQEQTSKLSDKSTYNGNLVYNKELLRKWNYYFAYCEAGFRTRNLSLTRMVFTRTDTDSIDSEV